jgi:PLP dependent protein
MPALERNFQIVQHRIANAATRSGRDPNDIRLIAVTKTLPPETVVAAYELGVRNFGENRVEEALDKIPAVRDQTSPQITWHMIGHLQSRKVKDAISLFDFIHSIDSVDLAERIDRRCEPLGKTMPILLEINASGEATKYGFRSEPRNDLYNKVASILRLGHIKVQGLMTIAPIVSIPDQARPFFRALRLLRDELCTRFTDQSFPHLSMGMTDDFEVAIEEGATMVRIGRAIFGERP